MKTTLVVVSLAVGIGLLTLNAQTNKSGRASEFKQPALRVDNAPVAEGKAPALTSYADSLTDVRSAVVSIYSSKIVRQQVPEMKWPAGSTFNA